MDAPTVKLPWVVCNHCGYNQEWTGDMNCMLCEKRMGLDSIATQAAHWTHAQAALAMAKELGSAKDSQQAKDVGG